METGVPFDAIVYDHLGFIGRLLRWIRKILAHYWTGKCEIQRICMNPQMSHEEKCISLRTSILLSKHLGSLKEFLCDIKIFEVDSMVKTIIKQKQLTFNEITKESLILCCKCFHYVNLFYQYIIEQTNECYDSDNINHEKLLESLWENLKPDIQRKGGRITSEWSEIGFQGKDPKSDFRGMGIFSLKQLVYFASTRPVDAKTALLDSNNPKIWYPFSITGINLTSFIMNLISERLLDHHLYRLYKPDAANEILFERGLKLVNDLYCDYFIQLNCRWVASNPKNLMEFPSIINSFRKSVRKQLILDST